MPGNIKGIVIRFEGDTTKLDKALRDIRNSTKDLDNELKQVDRALKFNPHNVDLWKQKQQILTEKIKQTNENLDKLKDAQAQMDAQNVDKSSEAYRTVQREIIQTESKLKSLEGQLSKVDNTIRHMDLLKASEKFKQMGTNLETAGRSMMGLSRAAAAVAASIGAVTVKSGKWADDINTMSKVYSIGTKELQQYSAAAELVDVDVETIAKSHSKLTKQMNSAADGTGASAEAFKKLDVDVTNADGSLRDGDAVWQDTIAALGKMENETERDALAMQLMGKSAQELNPLIEDGGETYKNLADTLAKYDLDYIDQETLDQANAFNDSLDTIKAVGMVAFQQLGTQLAAYLAPAMEKVVDLVGQIAGWFANLSPETQALIAGVAGFVAVLAPLLIGLGKVSFAISSIIGLVSTVGPAIAGVITTLGPIALIIAGVVAAGIALYKNWDLVKAKAIAFKNMVVATFNAFKAQVTAQFNAIKTAIVTPIQNAIDKVKAIIDKVKSFFPIKVGKLLSGLKLPHFKLNGKFSLNPPSVPKLSIDWYKTGGIFDNPSIIGVGEAGPEAVLPIEKLQTMIDQSTSQMAAAIITAVSAMTSGGGGIYQFNVEIGGTRVAEQIFRLSREGQMILEG